jgi:hypothetical protein
MADLIDAARAKPDELTLAMVDVPYWRRDYGKMVVNS